MLLECEIQHIRQTNVYNIVYIKDFKGIIERINLSPFISMKKNHITYNIVFESDCIDTNLPYYKSLNNKVKLYIMVKKISKIKQRI